MTTITPLLRIKERIVGPSGIYNIQNEWYGYADEFKYTIGLAGLMGFGVGCCPPELLPDDMAPLPGTEDRFSPNYGNYIHIPSASITCFIPAHHIEILSSPPTGHNVLTSGSAIVISHGQQGNSVLARPFTDAGAALAGIFVDKYQGSNCKPDGSGLPNHLSGGVTVFGGEPQTGGIFASRPLHWPVTPITKDDGGTDYNSPFSLCNSTALNGAATTPSDNYGGVWALCRTRGSDFHPVPIWLHTQIAYLSLAHAQALLDSNGTPISGATSNAAWMSTAPYAPKGNNNNGSDFQMGSSPTTGLLFARTDLTGHNGNGWAGRNSRAFTGAALNNGVAATEFTTHNGQLCGIVDIAGNQVDLSPGLTSVTTGMDAGGYRLLPDSVGWATISSNANIQSAAGLISLAAETAPGDDDGIWHTAENAWAYLQPATNGTFHPTSSWSGNATRKAMSECGIPRELGTNTTQAGTETNIFGGDGFYRSLTADCLPVVGSNSASTSHGGVFRRAFIYVPGNTINSTGARAARLLSA